MGKKLSWKWSITSINTRLSSKTKSFIDDEDVIEESLEFIHKNEGKLHSNYTETLLIILFFHKWE